MDLIALYYQNDCVRPHFSICHPQKDKCATRCHSERSRGNLAIPSVSPTLGICEHTVLLFFAVVVLCFLIFLACVVLCNYIQVIKKRKEKKINNQKIERERKKKKRRGEGNLNFQCHLSAKLLVGSLSKQVTEKHHAA